MVIKYNPRITKAFVKVVLRSKRVKDALHDIDSEEAREDAVHQILIEGFKKYNVDINDLVNFLKDSN